MSPHSLTIFNTTSVPFFWNHLTVKPPLVTFSSVTQSRPTLCNPMDCSTPGLPVHHQLLEFTQIHVHWVGDAIQPPHPLTSHSPPTFNLSQHQGLISNESVLHIRWPKYWSFSFSISPSNECSGLISFRMDWLDLLEVQGTLKSLLQHYSSKASILQRSSFFIVQLSHPYMTTRKTIALTRQTLVGKVMSLLFNMLSRLVITFLHLLISWLQSPFAVIWEPKKIVYHCFHSFPIYLPWSDGTRCHDLDSPENTQDLERLPLSRKYTTYKFQTGHITSASLYMETVYGYRIQIKIL